MSTAVSRSSGSALASRAARSGCWTPSAGAACRSRPLEAGRAHGWRAHERGAGGTPTRPEEPLDRAARRRPTSAAFCSRTWERIAVRLASQPPCRRSPIPNAGPAVLRRSCAAGPWPLRAGANLATGRRGRQRCFSTTSAAVGRLTGFHPQRLSTTVENFRRGHGGRRRPRVLPVAAGAPGVLRVAAGAAVRCSSPLAPRRAHPGGRGYSRGR
jgi:hypothetical protein